MSYDVTSYVVYGKVMNKQEFLDKNTDVEEMPESGIGYFMASNEAEEYVVVGFCLARNNGYNKIPFIETSLVTPRMQVELEMFFKQHQIDFFIEDFKTVVFAHHSY
jgi:hypothetical protein